MIHGHGGNIHGLAARLGCGFDQIIDMSSNINPLGTPPGLLDHLGSRLEEIGRLPEVDGGTMIARLASLLDVDPDRVLAGNGTTQFIYDACPALDARRVLVTGPTYADYADGCRMHAVAPRFCLWAAETDFAADVAQLDRAAADADLVFICNPNNPTGGWIPAGRLEALCARHPGTFFIIDESYLPFAPPGKARSMAHFPLENVIVLWSASKIFGMPGLRAGFLIAAPDVVARFRQFARPWCVNSLAQAAIAYLGSQKPAVLEFIRRTAAFLEAQRALFRQRLGKFDALTIYPSVTSYLLIRLPAPVTADDLCEDLARGRLLIRDCGNFHGLSRQYVRVALKSAEINALAAERIVDAAERLWRA